jgi:hypothetical protein
MAGLGRKVWSAGEVLAAADVNGYLMDQSVMVFSSAAARDSSVAIPSEGMLAYLTDSNSLLAYDGSNWVSANSVSGTVTASDVTGSLTNATIPSGSVVNDFTSSASSTYALASTDQGALLRFTAAGTSVVTVSTATAFSAGQRTDIIADGSGVRIEAGAGVTFGGAGTAGTAYTILQYEAMSVVCVASNNYRIIGNITTV